MHSHCILDLVIVHYDNCYLLDCYTLLKKMNFAKFIFFYSKGGDVRVSALLTLIFFLYGTITALCWVSDGHPLCVTDRVNCCEHVFAASFNTGCRLSEISPLSTGVAA